MRRCASRASPACCTAAKWPIDLAYYFHKGATDMNYNKKTIMDVDVAGKKILLRCDFNVPQSLST